MSKEAHNSICPECGSYRVTYEHTDDYNWQLCTCGRCGCSGTPDEFFHNSVFARITASPEVLAEKLVYCNVTVKTIPSTSREQPGGVELTKGWYSTIIHGKVWSNESEAIAATVAKLKEVER